jgi:MerR family transcriptional regulator/heat shock protein HspR
MNSDPSPSAEMLPDSAADNGTGYSLEVIAELAGVNTQTVIHYQQRGFLARGSRTGTEEEPFDTECLRQLRLIEHLRATCAMNEAGLELTLKLLQEVEWLRQERRRMLR